MKKRSSAIYALLLAIGIVLLLNVLAYKFFFRLDFTEDKQYTLSNSTKEILENLDEPVTITAYFSEDLPTHIEKIKTDFKDLLKEYERRSKGMVVFEFKNPGKDEEIEKEAVDNGIQQLMINVQEKDQVKQQKAYLGLIMQLGEQKEVIPTIAISNSMEYMLSSNIKKLSVTEKPKVGIIQGHGEPSLNAIIQTVQELSILYQVEPVTLNDSISTDLSQYKALAIIAPTDTVPPSQLYQIDNYLSNGGNLLMAINTVEGDFKQSMGKPVYTGLSYWLNDKGINIEHNLVLDAKCGSVQLIQQQGPFRIPTNIKFPYLPIIQDFAKHPITEGLETVSTQFVSSMSFTGDSSLNFTPLMFSSEKSASQSLPVYFNVQKNWTEKDFPMSKIPVAATLTGNIVGNHPSKMVVITDGDIAINGEGRNARQVGQDNVSLLTNSVDWLSDDTGLIELRTKSVTSRPIKDLTDKEKLTYKLINLLLPIFLIIVIGITINQRNKNIRIKRMEEGYV